MTLPAEEPGARHEPSGNRRPRGMVTLDRIRLTGLLRKAPAKAGAFYRRLQYARAVRYRIPGFRSDAGSSGDSRPSIR